MRPLQMSLHAVLKLEHGLTKRAQKRLVLVQMFPLPMQDHGIPRIETGAADITDKLFAVRAAMDVFHVSFEQRIPVELFAATLALKLHLVRRVFVLDVAVEHVVGKAFVTHRARRFEVATDKVLPYFDVAPASECAFRAPQRVLGVRDEDYVGEGHRGLFRGRVSTFFLGLFVLVTRNASTGTQGRAVETLCRTVDGTS